MAIALAMLCGCAREMPRVPAVAAAPGATDVDPELWGNDYFPVLNWDIPHAMNEGTLTGPNGLASQLECNFTMSGFVRPKDLPECERLGMKVIVAAGVPGFRPW